MSRAAVIAAVAFAFLVEVGFTSAAVSSRPDRMLTTDGEVLAVARDGNTVFLGQFSWVGAKTVRVKVKADVLAEENETFLLKVSAADNVAIADGTGRATIVDDD